MWALKSSVYGSFDEFFKKKLKKLKFEKGVPAWNISKNGSSRPLIGREGTSRPTRGRDVPKSFLQAPPEGPFANKKRE
jgi:hypothetical protein